LSTSSRAFDDYGRPYVPPTDRPGVLADVVPGGGVRDVVLVLAYAGLVGVFAQLVVPLPFTPVPITGQTFAVMAGAAVLGWQRAVTGMVLYLALGLVGVPWFAGQRGGIGTVTSASFGYVLGFVVAALVLGGLAGRRWDRSVPKAVTLFAVGSLIIYAFGLPWLMVTVQVGLLDGLSMGVTPFLLGDAIKILVAAGLLPGIWALLRRSG
jgi:biotin transport system substrate-specific component